MEIINESPLVDSKGSVFVDREQVQLIYNILERQSIVLLTGVGGVGKTTIAWMYMRKFMRKYISFSMQSFGKSKELQKEVDMFISLINSYEGKMLFIIDDIDKDALSIFSDRFGTINKNCHIILISRYIIQDLRIPVITIPGLSMADTFTLIERLFNQEITEKDKHIIYDLSNFVEGIPLSIKLMADIFNQKSYKSVSDFRNELVHNLAFTLGVAKKPVEIYVDTDNVDQIQKVYNQTKEFIKNQKFVIESELPPEKGSWYKRFFVRFLEVSQSDEVKEKVKEAEYGIKLHTITKQQSEIDKNQAEAVSSIIESIKEIPNAAIKVGSILIIKITDSNTPTISVKNLSLKEMLELENKPSLLKEPSELLSNLGKAYVE